MTDKTDIDNVRYSFETQEFFQRQIEEAINTLINEKNKENNNIKPCNKLKNSFASGADIDLFLTKPLRFSTE